MAASRGSANVLIKLQLVGDRQVKSGLKSIADESSKQSQRATRETEKSTKAQEKAAARLRRAFVRESQRAYREIDQQRKKDARDQAKAEAEKAKAAQKAARDADKADAEQKKRAAARRRSEVREIQRDFRDQQQALRTQERLRRQARTIGERRLAAGLAVGGVVAGTMVSAARDSQGVLGVRTQDAILGDSIAARQTLIGQVTGAGGDQRMADRILQRTIAAAQSQNVSPIEALQTVARLQEKFSLLGAAMQGGDRGLDDFFANLEGNMRFARASSDSTMNASEAMGALASQFGLNAAQQAEARGILFQGGQEGALTPRDFGELFPQVIASFMNSRGAEGSGLAGLREFTAIGQTLQETTQSPERTRTLLGAMMQNLSDENVQARLAAPVSEGGLGIQALNAQGHLRSTGDIAHQIAMLAQADPSLLTSTRFRSIFHDQEASAGMAALVQQDMRGKGVLTRTGVNADLGNANISRTAAALNADASGRAMRLANDREASVLRNSEQLIEANLSVAEGLTRLEDAFPRLTLALNRLAPLLQAIVSAAALKAILPGSFFSTLGGNTAPLGGAIMGPGGATYPGVTMPTRMTFGARLAAANAASPNLSDPSLGFASRLQAATIAVAAFEASLHGTLSLLDSFAAEGLLGSRLQHEGGSMSQDYAEFSLAKLFAGRYGVMDAITGNHATVDPEAQRRNIAAGGRPNRGANEDVVRAQNQGAREIVGAINNLNGTLGRIQPSGGGSTGSTTANRQSQ